MTMIGFIRHGATQWNAERRIQGLRDIPLSAEGRAALSGCRPPGQLAKARWHVSPLLRAVETAELLGVMAVTEPLLAEMDWGEWEGRTLAELRAADPEAMAANEAKGLDFRAPGGESPKDVQARLRDWAEALTNQGPPFAGPFGAVTHKGVIRAAVAMALEWDMLPPDPVKLRWDAAHILRVTADGQFEVAELNVPLARAEVAT